MTTFITSMTARTSDVHRWNLMNLLTEPLAYEFFRQGLAASALVGALCGMLGVYIVLRRMSYIGHGLSHAVFGGAVVAYVASSTSISARAPGRSSRR